ncbi:ketosteroid isomerase-like protein [Agrobacterium larrymoorei]|uniref:Ketosteroid isomerase-like protein n=1 Tax=Agrobacterium larrymoorei TaxID=160699 RepID=A0AAJ2ERY3_9HYPH|nr:nuclear transport factor 2 family protein [Agrobacterium larrymoorei]MDR6100928.1 ketosteroid isomerase-like protein [Agrobacterium larrymoorei]
MIGLGLGRMPEQYSHDRDGDRPVAPGLKTRFEEMKMLSVEEQIASLTRKVDALQAEADIRRIVSRYMFLCDVPMPEPDAEGGKRIDLILELFSDDAQWEGVGAYYDNQFGKKQGKAALRQHFEGFFAPREPQMILNCHYLTCEHIAVNGDGAEGTWVHFQPWIFSDGTSLLRSSRLYNAFKRENDVWKMSRYRTENVFVAPLPKEWWDSIPAESILMRDAAA